MKSIGLAVLVLQVAAPVQENPLAPMAAVAKAVDVRMAVFLSGTKASEAFENDTTDADKEKNLREALTSAKVARTESLAFETEVYLLHEGKPVYMIEVLFALLDGLPCLVGFRGHKGGGHRAKPLDEYKGDLAPVGEMARGVVALLSGEGWRNVTWADLEAFRKRDAAASFLGEMEQELKRGKEAIAKVAEEVAAVKHDALAFGIDDHLYLARSADGKAVGTITAKFKTRPGVPVGYVLGMFNAFETK